MTGFNINTDDFGDSYENSRGIPKVTFVENVEEYIKGRGIGADAIVRQFQELHSKYKLMEAKLQQNEQSLSSKLPDIEKAVNMIHFLKERAEQAVDFDTHYALTESVFCEAFVKAQPTVGLWLGSNVMADFTHDEALALLEKNREAASRNLETTLEDLAYLTDQKVILEVNIARVYNFEVVRRRKEKEAEEAAAKK